MPFNVIVSGGARGLGASVVTAVAKAGGRAGVLDRLPPAADVPHVRVDLADPRAAEQATRELAEELGEVSGVVTAAGVDVPGRLADVPAAEWDRVVAVDLLATAAVVRAALPYLARSGGTVVTVASTLGLRALPEATAYCAAKFGVVGFTRALAAELAGQVGVTLLMPGGMRTGFFDGREEKYRPPPDAKLNDPADVAAAVLFALRQPPGCAVRELVVCPAEESSYP
ncbi:MAG: SDR family oxidoreductase [Limnochordales bacterium]|jgi:NAD(P)-dependent dehydrogenase (short-subunit alcohol dehydrogenase family)